MCWVLFMIGKNIFCFGYGVLCYIGLLIFFMVYFCCYVGINLSWNSMYFGYLVYS